MLVDVNTKAVCSIDIDEKEAFRILCKTLEMDCVLDEDTDYYVVKDNFGYAGVYYTRNGHDALFDDRGDLFLALRNLAVELFPNAGFRKAVYDFRESEW